MSAKIPHNLLLGCGVVLDGETTGFVVGMCKGQIVMNGGEYGGMVKVGDMVSRLNAIEDDLNAIKRVFSAWKPVAQDGGAALHGAAAQWAAQSLTKTRVANIEDEKIRH